MGNSTSSSTKLNEIKKEKASYEEIHYDPDPPRCLASNQSRSFSLPRKIDMENPRFKSRMLPPTPNDETYALSELNHYDPISRGNFICKLYIWWARFCLLTTNTPILKLQIAVPKIQEPWYLKNKYSIST